MIISIDAEKTFDKIHHPFMIGKKNCPGNWHRSNTPIYDKSTANIILNDEKLNAFPLRSGTRQGCPLSPLLFNIVLEVLVKAIGEENEPRMLKKKQNSQFPDNMILYIENPKDATRKLLELNSE